MISTSVNHLFINSQCQIFLQCNSRTLFLVFSIAVNHSHKDLYNCCERYILHCRCFDEIKVSSFCTGKSYISRHWKGPLEIVQFPCSITLFTAGWTITGCLAPDLVEFLINSRMDTSLWANVFQSYLYSKKYFLYILIDPASFQFVAIAYLTGDRYGLRKVWLCLLDLLGYCRG